MKKINLNFTRLSKDDGNIKKDRLIRAVTNDTYSLLKLYAQTNSITISEALTALLKKEFKIK